MPPKKDNPGGGNGGGKGKGDKTAPIIEGTFLLTNPENTIGTFEFTASEEVIWSITGDDAALFSIDESGNLTFDAAPDYENPLDAGQDNVYDLTLQASDEAGNTSTQAISVTVENQLMDSTPPSLTSGVNYTIDENTTAVALLVAGSDVTWSLVGTVDDALFTLDPETGALAFVDPPDFEAPADANTDNTYSVTVQMEADGHQVTEIIEVTVNDVDETVPPTPYTSIAMFGDSWTDNGNFSDLAAQFLKPGYNVPFQYDGGDGSVRTYDSRAFSDGSSYSDTMVDLLGLSDGYENLAFGGAKVLSPRLGSTYISTYSNIVVDGETYSIVNDPDAALTQFGDFNTQLAAQVNRFLAANPDGAPEGLMFTFNAGGNDLADFDTSFWNILFGGVNAFADDIGDELTVQARRMFDAGAAAGVFFCLPQAEFFFGYENLGGLEALVAEDLLLSINEEILASANLLRSEGYVMETVRVDILSNELVPDGLTHGFQDTGPYLFGTASDPTWVVNSSNEVEPVFDVNLAATQFREEQLMFFDEVHFSEALNNVVAVFAAESLATEEVIGSNDGQTHNMGDADDFVWARDGDDTVNLGGGDDTAHGGVGDDILRGEEGSDLLIGAAGNDTLEGGDGMDFLAGSAGDDTLNGGADRDMLIGGLGGDTANGDAGDDIFIFIEEILWNSSQGSADQYYGGDGDDLLFVFHSSNVIDVSETANGTQLTFGALVNSSLTYDGIETVIYHTGLPEDTDSPLATLELPDDMAARYVEAQLWGIV